MDRDYKYIDDKDQYLDFQVGFTDITTQRIAADGKIMKLYKRILGKDECKNIPGGQLKMVESFLYLHQDREDYELCQIILDNYPELQNKDD